MRKFLLFLLPLLLFSQEFYYYKGGKKRALTPIERGKLRSYDTTLYFRDKIGIKLGVTNKLLVKLKESVLIVDVEDRYRVRFVRKVTPKILMFEAESPMECINVANKMVENKDAVFAHPDFISTKQRR